MATPNIPSSIPTERLVEIYEDAAARGHHWVADAAKNEFARRQHAHAAMRGYFDKMVNSVGAMASPLFLLLVRLRLPYESGAVPSFPGLKHVSVFVDDAKAHVFIVANDGQSSALSEDEKVFPSDDFIARMKILMEAQSGV